MSQPEQNHKNHTLQTEQEAQQESRTQYVRPTLEHQGKWQQVTLGSIGFPGGI